MADANTRRLANRYEIRSIIGRGGMAQVHLGYDTRLGRVVAIKMLRIDLARDAIFQARFRREAQAAASLNHPNIVGVYDTGEETVRSADGAVVSVPYIVMEYVEGHTVKDLLSDGTPVPLDEAVEITTGILAALEYSHASGLVHRDIKPGNIMLTPDGKVKVMDFGIARAITDSQATMTQTNAVVGTAQYLSPEQARGEKVDERSDIYSAGCVLFELLTGKPPFTGDSAVAVAYQHVSELPPTPSSIASDIPESLDRVTLQAMAKDPNARYASATLMSLDLKRAASGLDVDAPATASWTAVTTVLPVGTAATQAFPGPTRAQVAANGGDPSQTMTSGTAVTTEDAPKQKKTGRNVGITILVILAIAAVAGIAWLFLRGNTEPEVEQVAIPNGLIGMTQADARSAIEGVGLEFVLGEPVEDPDIEEGHVALVKPEEGALVDVGSEVTVQLSAGPGSVQIPNMTGYTQQQVVETLTGLGLEVGEFAQVDDPAQPEGRLLSTSPAAGEIVKAGTTVNLKFSSGNVVIPNNLVGAPEEDALAKLAELKLVASVQREYSEGTPAGIVMSLSASGKVVQGSTVTVTVSQGPEPVQPTPTTPTTPTTPAPPQSG